MTKKYKQLTLEQRYKIEALKGVGKTQTEIATLIGVHKSTISRELMRNIPKRGIGAKRYNAIKAQEKAHIRHVNKPKCQKFTTDLKYQAKLWLEEKKYSPELVAAQWKKQGTHGVSHETIYKFVWHCKHTNQSNNTPFKKLYMHLKHGKRRRKRGNYRDSRGLITNRVSIDQRPDIVNKRERYGDFEVDLILGKNHKSALLVMVDRASLITTIDKLQSKSSEEITSIILNRMKEMPSIKTMTFDNDQAFSQHEKIAEQLGITTYFTRPYTSQDKGTIENKNGIIRRFFPKKTDFCSIDTQEIKKVENLLNDRPVRKFNYLTPNEKMISIFEPKR